MPGPGVYEPDASAIVNEAEGGAVGTIRIADSTVSRNYAPQTAPGSTTLGSGALIVERSTIAHNTTEGNGGGIYSDGGTVTVVRHHDRRQPRARRRRRPLQRRRPQPRSACAASVTSPARRSPRNEAWAEGGAILQRRRLRPHAHRRRPSRTTRHEDAGGGLASARPLEPDDDPRHLHRNAALRRGRRPVHRDRAPGDDHGLELLAEHRRRARRWSGNDAGGGGIYTEGGPVEITRLDDRRQHATAEGGGICDRQPRRRDRHATRVVRGNSRRSTAAASRTAARTSRSSA